MCGTSFNILGFEEYVYELILMIHVIYTIELNLIFVILKNLEDIQFRIVYRVLLNGNLQKKKQKKKNSQIGLLHSSSKHIYFLFIKTSN